jgi:hypothetical protein
MDVLTFPEMIDSSMRSQFVTCPRKFYWSTIRHEAPAPLSIHLHAGATFARGIEATRRAYFQNGASVDEALAEGFFAAIEFWGDYQADETEVKSLVRILAALDFYITEKWPISSDYLRPYMAAGKAMVEFSFAIPLPINHPATGQPLIYCGRSDMIASYNEALFVTDEKTTTQLGPTWGSKWKLRAQFTGYVWAAKEFGYPIAGAIVRGISFLKAGYEGAEQIVYRPAWMITEWYEQLLSDIELMLLCWNKGRWGQNLDEACTMYGGCGYTRLCDSPNPEQWLRPYYARHIWNPLAQDDAQK